MNIGMSIWQVIVVLFNLAVVVIPIIFIIWLVIIAGRIEQSLGRIETKMEQLQQR